MIKKLFFILVLFFSINVCAQDIDFKNLETAPAFSLRRISYGDTSDVSLSSYTGNIVIICFFRRWDQNSVLQLSAVKKIQDSFIEEQEQRREEQTPEEEQDSLNVSAIGISTAMDANNNMTRFIHQLDIKFYILGYDDQVVKDYNATTVPITMILTPELKIYKRFNSLIEEEDLKNEVEVLMQALSQPVEEEPEEPEEEVEEPAEKVVEEPLDIEQQKRNEIMKQRIEDMKKRRLQEGQEKLSPEQRREQYMQHREKRIKPHQNEDMVYDTQTGASLPENELNKTYSFDEQVKRQKEQRKEVVEVTDSQTGQTREELYDSNPAQTLY